MEPYMSSTPNPSLQVGQERLQNLGLPAISSKTNNTKQSLTARYQWGLGLANLFSLWLLVLDDSIQIGRMFLTNRNGLEA